MFLPTQSPGLQPLACPRTACKAPEGREHVCYSFGSPTCQWHVLKAVVWLTRWFKLICSLVRFPRASYSRRRFPTAGPVLAHVPEILAQTSVMNRISPVGRTGQSKPAQIPCFLARAPDSRVPPTASPVQTPKREAARV